MTTAKEIFFFFSILFNVCVAYVYMCVSVLNNSKARCVERPFNVSNSNACNIEFREMPVFTKRFDASYKLDHLYCNVMPCRHLCLLLLYECVCVSCVFFGRLTSVLTRVLRSAKLIKNMNAGLKWNFYYIYTSEEVKGLRLCSLLWKYIFVEWLVEQFSCGRH